MKRSQYRNWIALSVLAVMLLITACGGSSAPKPGASSGTPKPSGSSGAPSGNDSINLRVWITGPNYQGWIDEQVKAFENENPGIKVETLTLDWGSYMQKILTAMAGGGAPDLVSLYSVDIAPMVAQGVLQPISPFVDTSLFVDNHLSSGLFGGQLYALPLGMKVRPLYYRADLLEMAGLSGPPTTYEEFTQLAVATTEKDASGNVGRVGFWIPTDHQYKTVQTWWVFLMNNGGQMFDVSGKPAFNSPEGVEATQLFTDLLQAGVDVPGTITTDNTDWAQEKVANLVSNLVTRNLKKDHPEMAGKLGMAVPPYGKEPVIELSGEVLAMTSKTTNREAAAKLLNFLAAREESVISYVETDASSIPGLRAAQQNPYITGDEWFSQMQDLGNQYGTPLPAHPHWTEVNDILKKALTEAWTGLKTAQAALDEAAAKIEALGK